MTRPGENVSARWAEWREQIDLEKYDARWEAMAARGDNVHGEADAVIRLIETHLGGRVCRIFDAGCGTGRLAVELERRGHTVTGVDLDSDMVDKARPKSQSITWLVGDLATVDLAERFDVVVMIGNILNFCEPGSQSAIVRNLLRHLRSGGLLVCGWSQEKRSDSYLAPELVTDAAEAGASHVATWRNWDGDPFDEHSGDSDYAVVIVRGSAESGA
jgi:SAM-dependent methyltransferase